MKLSEAIRLGAMALPPVYGPVFRGGPDGQPCAACAIGAALFAIGLTDMHDAVHFDSVIERVWPWTSQAVKSPVGFGKAVNLIVVMYERHGYTREQIADWVETLERAQEPHAPACESCDVAQGQAETTAVALCAPK